MSQSKDKFIALLEELFQLNQPELDFGLYRILHARSGQIKAFMQTELKETIDKVFAKPVEAGSENPLDAARRKVEDVLGEDAFLPDGELKPEYKESKVGRTYRDARQQARSGNGPLSDDAQVYEHLYRFFSRYYDKGDFMSRRYFVAENDSRAAPYAVPYDGREVMLHWANKDQYYIKSSEYLANFSFNLAVAQGKEQLAQGSLALDNTAAAPLKAHFRLAAAAEGEHNNVKEGQERFFLIHQAEPIKLETGARGTPELVVQFEYRPDPDKTGQAGSWQQKRLAEAEALVKERLAALPGAAPFARALFSPAPTDKQPERTLLAKYLGQFTSRNTMDYFIHKDLGGFLRRELDFYIKNEIMRLDDIENAEAPRVESYLAKLKSLRQIARRIIDFLAQIEDFQKKLWLKKKFVVDTQYCITLDRIPESFYAEIAANERQREEWVRLFAIDEIKGHLASPEYSTPVTATFLKANDKLLVDTGLFDDAFRERILASIDGLENAVTGVLVHSDNFQALQAMRTRYQEQVKCIYIDPPYNTASSSIPYKNDYKHSSFASMMNDRIGSSRTLLKDDGAIFVSIDKAERTSLEHVLDGVFGSDNHIEELIWTQNTANGQLPNFATNHEYVEVFAKERNAVEQDAAMFREPKPGYAEIMEMVARIEPNFPSIAEIEAEIRKVFDSHISTYKDELEANGREWDEDAKRQDPWRGIYPYHQAEYRDATGKLVQDGDASKINSKIWIWREISPSAPASKQAASTRDASHHNYRFYKPIHPVTGKHCPHPKGGWKFPYSPDPAKSSRRSFTDLKTDHRIVWGADEKKVPQTKGFLHEVETNIGTSVFYDYNDGEAELAEMFGQSGLFLSPKSSRFVRKFIAQATKTDSVFFDFFGGSGSSAHAVIAQNRQDTGHRKYVLIEMGTHFDTLLCPRILKATYSTSWRDGKPLLRDGISQCIRRVRLESYEDTLNNLLLNDTPPLPGFTPEAAALNRDYLLKYWLQFETADSPSLLNVREFADPTAYKLRVKQPGTDAQVEKSVDLVETFNWLIGLHVAQLDRPRRYQAELVRDPDPELPADQATRWKAASLKERDEGEFWFRSVEGHVLAVPGDQASRLRVLVLWRKLTGDAGRDQAVLEAYLEAKKINPCDSEFDFIYINGSHALPSDGSARTRVLLTEETFAQRMWEDA